MDKVRNPVGWFEIYVQDMARARAFYTAVFGRALERLAPPPEAGHVAFIKDTEGNMIGLHSMQ